MNDTPTSKILAEWEYALLNQDPPAEAVEASDRRLAEQQAEKARKRAAQVASYPTLHEVKDGGTTPDGGTVQLRDVWEHCNSRLDGLPLLEYLAEEAGGLAIRLIAGIHSLLGRRDCSTNVHVKASHGEVRIRAWSESGCWRDRAWWLDAAFIVRQDDWGQIRLEQLDDLTFAVRGRGGATVYVDNYLGPVRDAVTRWYLGWEGRRALRERLGYAPVEQPEEPLSLEEFLNAGA